jgi:hypothetical protein
MIDTDSLCTSESALENLQTMIAEFYNVMCKPDVLPIEEIKRLEDKRNFAFICKCGLNHVGHGSIWSAFVVAITSNTPVEGHPEFEEYMLRRKEFLAEVEHIKVRDYAEPFLMASDEGSYIKASLEVQKNAIADFKAKLCSSKVTPTTASGFNIVVSYYCEKHETSHYVSPQANNHHRALINGSKIPEEYAPFMCKLSQRVVFRIASEIYREWDEANPQNKVPSIANRKKQEEKAVRRELDAALVAAAQEKNRRKKAARERIKKKKAKKANKAKTYDDPNLYILKPNLMSEEWLVEYQVCGRKVSYSKVSEALIFKHTQTSGEYEVYECSYCSGWHLGHKGKEEYRVPARQAKSGLFWYRQNHKKANAFIHKIMMEDFA